MAQNIYRRDTKENLLRLIPSSKEIFTIEDNAKHGILYFGNIRTLAQFFENGEGIEIRDWDPNFSKAPIGQNALDVSISLSKYGTGASGSFSFVSGLDTTASGISSNATGSGTVAEGQGSNASGVDTTASGSASHAEGNSTTASGDSSHSEGTSTVASNESSHAEGDSTVSSGTASHSEGKKSTASGKYSHTEGEYTEASGEASHAEGDSTTASGLNSHTEGKNTLASEEESHAEGTNTQATGISSHAEGSSTTASGEASHAEGRHTIAQNENQHSEGKFNVGTNPDTIHETGIGVDETSRKNAFEIYLNGILKAPETMVTELFAEMKALVTSEFVQEKIAIENWFTDFTYSSGTIFRSNIPFDDKHANISAVFQGGIMLRPSKYTLINDGGFKAVQIGSSITLNQGDWVSLQLNRVYYKDY